MCKHPRISSVEIRYQSGCVTALTDPRQCDGKEISSRNVESPIGLLIISAIMDNLDIKTEKPLGIVTKVRRANNLTVVIQRERESE